MVLVMRLCCCVEDDFVRVAPHDVDTVKVAENGRESEGEGVSDESWETPPELSDADREAEESSNSEKSSGDEVRRRLTYLSPVTMSLPCSRPPLQTMRVVGKRQSSCWLRSVVHTV